MNIIANIDLSDLDILRESEIQCLPLPVQRYIFHSRAIGKPKVKSARIKQEGLFRINDKKWTHLEAEQFFNMESTEFVWKAKAASFRVVDQFVQNKGSLIVRLFNWIPMGKAQGPEVDQGEAIRYLTELIWFPSAFLSPSIHWQPINETTAQATIQYGDQIGSAIFHFDPTGLLTKIRAQRYKKVKNQFELHDWEINHLEYRLCNGLYIPYKAHVNWMNGKEEECYYKLVITEVETNV